ncbi:hypothetical protein EJB05_52587, partial [Eragrostis curvula]
MATQGEPVEAKAALNDDLLTEILLRLPSLSVLRFRAVCRAWRALTSTPAFVAAHARRRPLELISQHHMSAGSLLDTVPLATLDEEKRRCLDPGHPPVAADARDEAMGLGHRLIACCDGLLLYEYCRRVAFPHYLVCNQVTRQWTAVPAPSSDKLTLPCGFYLHEPTGEHRILFLTNDEESGGMGYSASHFVRSLEAAETRRLGPASKALHVMDPLFMAEGWYYRRKFHWLNHPEAKKDAGNIILAFDTVSETFRRMRRPTAARAWDHLFLMEMDGMLAMTAASRGVMDLWVLEDYSKDDTWTYRLRIDLPPTMMTADCAINVDPAILLLIDYGNRSLGLYHLTEKRVLKEIQLRAGARYVFRDSLPRHAFF